MKTMLRSATALVALTVAGTAVAADLPYRSGPPPMETFTPIPVFTWTGFYAGLNAGYGFGTKSDSGQPTVIGVPANGVLVNNAGAPTAGVVAFGNRNNDSGFVGGGQIGYNWQITPGSGFVVGFEADAQFVGFGSDKNQWATLPGTSPAPGIALFNPNGSSSLDYFGTVRGRLGYAFDRALLYGTGGFAYGGGGGDDLRLPSFAKDEFRTGWAAGGGVEYALPTSSFLNFFNSSAVTLRVEGLYVNLEGIRNSGAFAQQVRTGAVAYVGPNGVLLSGPANPRSTNEFAVVRAGINYKFGSY